MYNEPKNYPTPKDLGIGIPCEPVETPKPLNERTSIIHDRLDKVYQLAEAVYCELYGATPSPCDDNGNKPRYSLEETINSMGYKLTVVEDCLSDTLRRLRG